MPKSNSLSYIDIGGDIKKQKQKPVDIKVTKKILDIIRDSVPDYVPKSSI